MSDLAIRVSALTKSFGDVPALNGIDLEVQVGRVFGLLGPNGAGKTTAVRILTTILQPTSGVAEVLGVDVTVNPQYVRENIGLAGQYAAVDENLTGRENLRLIGKLAHMSKPTVSPRADELLERFGLSHAADRPSKTYSGGMRRRLDLAAALVHSPPVLFLDEPTTGLDPASRKDLWTVIEELVADGTTVLLTTQYLEEADRLADRLAVIDAGRVIAEGTPHELKSRLGATVIEIGFGDPATATTAADTIRRSGAAGSGSSELRIEGSGIELPVDDGPRAVIGVLRALDEDGLSPATLNVREPSLDDVFLSLTGHRTAGDQDSEPTAGPVSADAAPVPKGRPDRNQKRGAA